MNKIIPAILSNKFDDFNEKLSRLKNFDLLQIDVCDGKFVAGKTVQPDSLLKVKKHPELEIHLMVKDVNHYVEHFVHCNVQTIVFHFEACKNSADVLEKIQHIKSHCVKVGIAINPETSILKIKQFLKLLDQVLIMTVHPGMQGQKFIPKMLEKIRELRKLDKKIAIEVDGGINAQTALLAKKNGANLFVVGSGILNAKSPKKAFENISKSLGF